MENVTIINHPLMSHKVALLRDKNTNTQQFRELVEEIYDKAVDKYESKIEENKEKGVNFGDIERHILLNIMDRKWIDHIDNMDNLRQGVGLRAYGNKNPITIYQTEGFDMFDDMITAMRRDVANALMGIKRVERVENIPVKKAPKADRPQGTVKKTEKEVGRNDPCPCGSGKKYKNCCGKN